MLLTKRQFVDLCAESDMKKRHHLSDSKESATKISAVV